MKFSYELSVFKSSSAFEGGKIYQPKVKIVLVGPRGEHRFKAIVDTGSDQTILPALDVEEFTGITIDRKVRATVMGRLRHHQEELFLGTNCQVLLSGENEFYQWPAAIWFSDDATSPPILGHSGFLEFFTATFDGFKKELTLTPNKNFPGRAKRIRW